MTSMSSKTEVAGLHISLKRRSRRSDRRANPLAELFLLGQGAALDGLFLLGQGAALDGLLNTIVTGVIDGVPCPVGLNSPVSASRPGSRPSPSGSCAGAR